MKLIITFISGADYEESSETIPVNYPSARLFLKDLKSWVNSSIKKDKYSFNFVGREWYVHDFVNTYADNQEFCNPPKVESLNEWFKRLTKIKIDKSN